MCRGSYSHSTAEAEVTNLQPRLAQIPLNMAPPVSQGSPWEPLPVDSLSHLHRLLEASKSGCEDVNT